MTEFGVDDEAVEQYENKANEAAVDGLDVESQVRSVLSELEEQLKEAQGQTENGSEIAAAGEAFVNVAEREGTGEVIQHLKAHAGGMSGGAVQVSADKIRDGLVGPVRDLQIEQVNESPENTGTESLENGVGFDEYLEDWLESIERVETTDHYQNEVIHRFSFTDGTVVESEGEHLFQIEFYRLIGNAANAEVKPETVGDKIADTDSEDGGPVGNPAEEGSSDRELLKRKSPGPDSRTWLSSEWTGCVTNLVEKEASVIPPEHRDVGPRTDAWVDLMAKVGRSQAVRDLHDAFDESAVYVHTRDDGEVELWIPTKMVDAACEDYNTDRQGLAREVNARGAVSREVSGGGASYETSRTSPSSYWWRVEKSHPDVEWPEAVVDELGDDTVWTGGSSDVGSTTGFGGDA